MRKFLVLAAALASLLVACSAPAESVDCPAPDAASQPSDAAREEVAVPDVVTVEIVEPDASVQPDVLSEDAAFVPDTLVVMDVVEPDVMPDADVSMVDATPDVSRVDAVTDASPDASVSADVPTAPPGSRIYRSRDGRGDFWFCGEYPGYPAAQYGYRGCCTNGRWSRPEDFGRVPGIYAGAYVRSLAAETVYYIMEQRGTQVRVRMPTSKVLLSHWSHPATVEGSLLLDDPAGCAGVEEADEAMLNALPEAGTALFKAGTTFTGRLGDRYRYVAGSDRTLHPIRFDGGFTGMGLDAWTGFQLNYLPSSVFELYTIGAPVDVMSTDNPRVVLERYTSMERLGDLFP